MIITSGELLCAVVNDILDFSKLESGNVLIEIRPVSLQDTLDSVVNSIEHKAQRKRIAFETTYTRRLPEHIETDGNRLQQILYNLLANALKFSDTGGSVELSSTTYPTSLRVTFRVRQRTHQGVRVWQRMSRGAHSISINP
jgi:signal transduction histidine kinase